MTQNDAWMWISRLWIGAAFAVAAWMIAADAWRREAIDAGAARWQIDATSGEREFVWVTCEEPDNAE